MMAYRWAASSSLFLGAVSTALALEEASRLHLLPRPHGFVVFFGGSLFGIAASLVARFLHPTEEAPLSFLWHPAVPFIGLALNGWPWMRCGVRMWFVEIGPP